MDSPQCGVCLENKADQFMKTTRCCSQNLCTDCNASVEAYSAMRALACPFCRSQNFIVEDVSSTRPSCLPQEVFPPARASLEGTWDVHITERSSMGTVKYTVTLDIDGNKGSYVSPTSDGTGSEDNHYTDGSWGELKAFEAGWKVRTLRASARR